MSYKYSYLIIYENGERRELDDEQGREYERALLAKPRAEREKLHEQGLVVKFLDGMSYKLLGYWR